MEEEGPHCFLERRNPMSLHIVINACRSLVRLLSNEYASYRKSSMTLDHLLITTEAFENNTRRP